MFRVRVTSGFSAAHRLRNYRGRCENLHGHNWRVEVTVAAEQLDKTGMVVDFKALRARLDAVLNLFDHTNLNRLPYFKKTNPTSENIAKFIYDKLSTAKVPVTEVCVWESPGSCATYKR